MLSPEDYCWDRLDTDLRYAALMAPRRHRAATAALMTLWQEITSVAYTVTEPAVAAQKLGWWRQELERMAAGQPRHPAAVALAPHLAALREPASALEIVIAATLEETTRHRIEHLRDLEALGARQIGTLLAMSSALLDAGETAPAGAIGGALKVLEVVRQIGWLARHDRVLLPREEMARVELSAEDVLERRPVAAFGELVGALGDHAGRMLGKAFAATPGRDRRAWKPARALAAIALARQRQIDAEPMAVLDARIDLPPIRKLWLAWRAQVSPARRQRGESALSRRA